MCMEVTLLPMKAQSKCLNYFNYFTVVAILAVGCVFPSNSHCSFVIILLHNLTMASHPELVSEDMHD